MLLLCCYCSGISIVTFLFLTQIPLHGPLYTVCDVDRENDTRQQWKRTAKSQAVEKIAVKCCKVTTVYIRSWIAEESTRVFIFGLSLNGFTRILRNKHFAVPIFGILPMQKNLELLSLFKLCRGFIYTKKLFVVKNYLKKKIYNQQELSTIWDYIQL